MKAFKYEVVVGKDGRIEVPFSDLPEGALVEAIFLMQTNSVEKQQDTLTWEELSQRIEAAGVDPDRPSLQEISEIVKEVRKSRRAKIA
jgi:hypothetical protein